MSGPVLSRALRQPGGRRWPAAPASGATSSYPGDPARARLGARFDIRRFHRVLLDQGAMPLAVLDRLVNEWIAAEAAKS